MSTIKCFFYNVNLLWNFTRIKALKPLEIRSIFHCTPTHTHSYIPIDIKRRKYIILNHNEWLFGSKFTIDTVYTSRFGIQMWYFQVGGKGKDLFNWYFLKETGKEYHCWDNLICLRTWKDERTNFLGLKE